MKYLKWTAPLLALGFVAVPAQAEEASATVQQQQEEASIYFVNQRGIRSWRVGDDQTLYIQDRGRDWYEAKLMYPVHSLHFARAIGFDTGGVNRLDNFSTVVVEGQRVPIDSLVKIGKLPPTTPDRA